MNTKEDRLSFLQDWLRQYDSAHAVHYFTETRLGIAVVADDQVRRAHIQLTTIPYPASTVPCLPEEQATHTHSPTPSTRPCRESGPWRRVYFIYSRAHVPRTRSPRAWPRTMPSPRLRGTASNVRTYSQPIWSARPPASTVCLCLSSDDHTETGPGESGKDQQTSPSHRPISQTFPLSFYKTGKLFQRDDSHHTPHTALTPLTAPYHSHASSSLAALCFRHLRVSLDEQRSGATHRLDNGERRYKAVC